MYNAFPTPTIPQARFSRLKRLNTNPQAYEKLLGGIPPSKIKFTP